MLPLRGSSYRYSYALQSELLKQNPLRELAIDVQVHSALPLKQRRFADAQRARTSRRSTRPRSSSRPRSTRPTRDFEVVIDVERQGQDVVVIPHHRGDDGYFMLLLKPPGGGAWERAVSPTASRWTVIMLADTSGVDGSPLREAQDQFVAALLGLAGAEGHVPPGGLRRRMRLGDPRSRKRQTQKNIAAAREFLGRRRSLGWTDLDAAFEAVIEKAGPNTQVDLHRRRHRDDRRRRPGRFANRLKQMYTAQGDASTRSHRAAPTSRLSSDDRIARRRLGARIAAGAGQAHGQPGGGCTRTAQRDRTAGDPRPEDRVPGPARGARVSRALPNLPAGTQQIVLGRYLPDAASTEGEIVVTGTQDGKAVRFRTAVSLEEAAAQARCASEQSQADEHSFIPRLWARMHLDTLLEQGQTQVIQDEIIALSEEYQIMTPYTSLLGAGKRRRPRAVQGQAAVSDARRREVLRPRPRQRQLRACAAADEAGRQLADEPAAADSQPACDVGPQSGNFPAAGAQPLSRDGG